MNYQLSSSRQIGNFKQKCIVNIMNCVEGNLSTRIQTLKNWITAMESLDYTSGSRANGTVEYKALVEGISQSTGNNGTKGDVIFTVRYTGTAGVPKMITTKITDASSTAGTSYAPDLMDAAYSRLTGLHINTQYCYLINVIVNLHN